MNIYSMTIRELHTALREGRITVDELTKEYRNNIAEKDGEIQAYLELFDACLLRLKFCKERETKFLRKSSDSIFLRNLIISSSLVNLTTNRVLRFLSISIVSNTAFALVAPIEFTNTS